MDSVLLGVLRSEHPAALKVVLTRHLVQKSAHLPVSEDDCRRILTSGVVMIQSAPTTELAEAGALIIKQWGQWNGAVLERCALPVVLQPLLAGPVPLHPSVGPGLLGWLLERLPAQQAGVLLGPARRLLAEHAAHPAHTAETLAALAGLMLDWPQCRPRFEEAVTLSQAVIRAIAAQRMPDQSSQIGTFVTQMERLQQLLQQLFASTQTVIRAMDTLYEVMSDAGGGPVSPALSVVLQAVPVKLISPACSQLVSLRSGGVEATCRAVGLLCDWLLVWPRAPQLAVWLGSLVREAAGRGHTAALHQLVLARVDKLFQGLTLPAVRRAVFPVVSLMLLGFQQTPAAFFKVLPRVPSLLDQLRQEGGPDSAEWTQLADLVQTLMRLHPGCVQRYTAVTKALQGRPPPPPSVMASLLLSAAWTDPAARSEPPHGRSAAPAAAVTSRRRGLVNLGNTCYMNAVLQALYHSDQFCREVLAARPSVGRRHLAALQRVFAFLAFSERPAYSPAEFQRVALPPWFEHGRQHDCSEFLRYLLDAIHEEERAPAPPGQPSRAAVPCEARPAATARAQDDSGVSRPGAAGRPRPRRRHRSCDTASAAAAAALSRQDWLLPGPGPGSAVPLSDRVSDDVVMAEAGPSPASGPLVGGGVGLDGQGVSADGCEGRTAGGGQLSSPGHQPPGPCDGVDTTTTTTTTTSSSGGELPAAGLVRRLLTGRAETSYTCCTCGTVSRHVDRVTDLHLALPEALTRPRAQDEVEQLPVFGPQPRPAPSEAQPDPEQQSNVTSETQTPVGQAVGPRSGPDPEPQANSDTAPQFGPDPKPQFGPDQEPQFGPDPEPQFGPDLEPQFGPDPEPQFGPDPEPQFGPDPEPQFGPDPEPQFGPDPEPQFGPDPEPQFVPDPEPRPEVLSERQPEIDLTVSDLLHHYLEPERLCGDNQYHCSRCGGLQDAERRLRLLAPPHDLVVSLVRFVFDRRTGARRKVLAPVGLTERLSVPLAGRPAAQYRLYAVIVHAGHSLDAGHYFSFCRGSGGGDGGDGPDGDDGWWRLDDTSAAPVTAVAALGRPRRGTDAAYTLMYRLTEAAPAGPLPALQTLPAPLRAALERDNETYRRESQGRPAGVLPVIRDGRPPPGAGCGGDSGHSGPSFVC